MMVEWLGDVQVVQRRDDVAKAYRMCMYGVLLCKGK